MNRPLYFDYQATTPVDRLVFEAMRPYFMEEFGNASSRSHAYGWAAEAAVDKARTQVASLIGATAREIVFTSGATESNALALVGAARARKDHGRHIVTTAVEHKSVLEALDGLKSEGFDITVLPVDSTGRVNVVMFEKALRADTILASVILAQNEVGTLNSIAEIGAVCHHHGVWFHVDAVQAVGKIPVDVEALSVDLLSLSGHKIYGPKGVGALFVRRRGPHVDLIPLQKGGGHERGLRAGTLNVPGIVGLGAACALASIEMPREMLAMAELRDRLWTELQKAIPGLTLNGHPRDRLPHNLNFQIAGVTADAVLAAAKGLALSTGSACVSETLEPSYVLSAMGLSRDEVLSSVRMSVGRLTKPDDVSAAVAILKDAVEACRR